ncbi:MAG: serine/threonine protein kinase [Anaerolineae bacterium]|nr:serine/threonine protein kinase [Anaerolineae bacterium]
MLINNYQVEEEIGRGITAVVYRATNPQGQVVTLKMSRDNDPDRLRQIKQEAEVLSWLNNEGVPHCYDYFEFEGQGCVTLEFVAGKTFKSLMQEQRPPYSEAQAVQWGIQLADILDRIHTHPTPHIYRSLAPHHLLLTESGQLYLIDYGKVEPYKPDALFPAIGFAGYSPPEQYVGRPEPRGDIFSLGVFLYHVTTGRDPHLPHAAFLFHVLPPRAINPQLSPEFERIVLQAVEHKASDRFTSIAAMREALLACSA